MIKPLVAFILIAAACTTVQVTPPATTAVEPAAAADLVACLCTQGGGCDCVEDVECEEISTCETCTEDGNTCLCFCH